MSEELLPCPMCGASAVFDADNDDHEQPWYTVSCTKCHVMAQSCSSKESSVTRWNLRAPVSDAVVERMCRAYWGVVVDDPLRSSDPLMGPAVPNGFATPHMHRCMRAALAAMGEGK